MVATQMTAEMSGNEMRKITPEDIAEAAMLAVRMSNSACPQVSRSRLQASRLFRLCLKVARDHV